MAESRPLVSIVTVNYNGRTLLETFLASVDAQDFPQDELEVVVVDNGSADDSVEYVKKHHPRVRIVANGVNRGFAAGSNDGARAAAGRYLALLNNDMRLNSGWVAEMVRYLEQEPDDVVCAGSLILSWDGDRIDFGGATMAFNGVGFQLFAGLPVSEPLEFPDRILFPCGGAMMIEREAFLSTGGFDEDYFAYLEDVDLGWRLWLTGFEVGFCRDAVTRHMHNATSRMFAEHRKNVLIERNALATMVKNYDDGTLSLVFPGALLLAVKRLALRSGVRRSEFAFLSEEQGSLEPTSNRSGRRSLALRAANLFRALRKHGFRFVLRVVWLKAAARVPRAQPDAPTTRRVEMGAYSIVPAIEDLIDWLPALLERRAVVQAMRVRTDEEIFGIMRTPFRPQQQPPTLAAEYDATFERIVDLLGIRARFDQRLPAS